MATDSTTQALTVNRALEPNVQEHQQRRIIFATNVSRFEDPWTAIREYFVTACWQNPRLNRHYFVVAEQQVTSPEDLVSIYRALWSGAAEVELDKLPAYQGSRMENKDSLLGEVKAIKPKFELVGKIVASQAVSRLDGLRAGPVE